VRTLEIDGDRVDLRMLVARDNEPIRMAAYMTICNHRATASPFREQLRTALAELFSSPSPLTMYFVFGEISYRDLDAADARAEAWLESEWRQYRAACLP